MGGLHTQFIKDLGSLIRRLAADKPAARVPSEHECRFCDITAEDCPARVNSNPSTHEGTTMEFRSATKEFGVEAEAQNQPALPADTP